MRTFLDCDVIVKFTRPQIFSFGMLDQTYYEMGSFSSSPCRYRSPKVKSMEVVFTKRGSQFRPNQVPTYGPVGTNRCLSRLDRSWESYSMLEIYESLSMAKKYCNMYRYCDIIVEIDRSEGMNLY